MMGCRGAGVVGTTGSAMGHVVKRQPGLSLSPTLSNARKLSEIRPCDVTNCCVCVFVFDNARIDGHIARMMFDTALKN